MEKSNNDDKKKSLANINDIYSMMQKVVGTGTCDIHEQEYNLYETPVGKFGKCLSCFREQIKDEDKKIVELSKKPKKVGKSLTLKDLNVFQAI